MRLVEMEARGFRRWFVNSCRKGLLAMAGVRDLRDGLILDGMASWQRSQ